MLAAVRFLWNATRGNRLTPWRSDYLKWRMETYSGMKADKIGPREFWSFTWRERGRLMHFLRWTGEMRVYANASSAKRAD